MGQKAGKAQYEEASRPFLNLSAGSLGALWDAFNDVAEGFGINGRELSQMCAVLLDDLQITRRSMEEKSLALFKLFDTDFNGLVDAIELMSALAMSSGLSPPEKLSFILNCYDFGCCGEHTIDELALAVKSALSGMCKLVNQLPPRDEEIEELSLAIFSIVATHSSKKGEGAAASENSLSAHEVENLRVPAHQVISEILMRPEAMSWVNYFDDSEEAELEPLVPLAPEVDYQDECRHPPVSSLHAARAEEAAASYASFCKENGEMYGGDSHAPPPQPWRATVRSMAPTKSVEPSEGVVITPQLQLDWIYGYSSSAIKNNARYTLDEEVVYTAGRAGVVYSCSKHGQKQYLGHTGDIRSFALHPGGLLVATGEFRPSRDAKAIISVWDTRTVEVLRVLQGIHEGGVTQLAFSRNGCWLVSLGADHLHSIAIYDWNAGSSGVLIASASGSEARVFACCFAGSRGNNLVVCGEGSATFWRVDKDNGLVGLKGIFGKKARKQALLACAPLDNSDQVVTGCASGHIYMWSGRNCTAAVKAHHGSVGALSAMPGGGFISGGVDMRVRIWSRRVEPGAVFDLSSFGPLSGVRSVCASSNGSKILVGLASGRLHEISSADGSDIRGGPIAEGHSPGKRAMGLAVHPSQGHQFTTVGDDGAVITWDAKTREKIRMGWLDSPARCVDYSPDGSMLAIGLGDGLNKTVKEGAFAILRASDFFVIYEARDSTSHISEIRWAPDGETLALGAGDGSIYLYATHELCHAREGSENEVKSTVQLSASIKNKFRDATFSMDFSSDGLWLRVAGRDGHVLFFDSSKGEQQNGLASLRDVDWATETCPYKWQTLGASAEKLLSGACLNCTDGSRNGIPLLLLGDSFGRLRLFSSAVNERGDDAVFQEVRGHERPGIARVRFLKDSTIVLSCGGADGCILQWSVCRSKEKSAASNPEEDLAQIFKEEDPFALQDTGYADDDAQQDAGGARDDIAPSPGDGSYAPWMEASLPPTLPPKVDPSTPNHDLIIESLHGYAGRGLSNAVYSSGGECAIFAAASVVVRHNLMTGHQAFQAGHRSAITCMDIDSSGTNVATGERSSKGRILVWEAASCKVLRELSGIHRSGISAIAFSPNGRYIVSCSDVGCNPIVVQEWRSGNVLAASRSGPGRIMDIAWGLTPGGTKPILLTASLLAAADLDREVEHHQQQTGQGESQRQQQPICLWDMGQGDGSAARNLARRPVYIGAKGKRQNCYSCTFVAGTGSNQDYQAAVVGTSDGHIYAFLGDFSSLGRAIKAHTGAVYALKTTQDRKRMISGGRDGITKVFGAAPEFQLLLEIPSSHEGQRRGAVRSVSYCPSREVALIGLWGGDLYEMPAPTEQSSSSSGHQKVHICGGHSAEGVSGLCAHPLEEESFVSVGLDGILRVWNRSKVAPAKELVLDTSLSAVSYSPDAKRLALGCGGNTAKCGSLLIIDATSFGVIHEGKDANGEIFCITYAPDGRRLAVASQDLRVYVYHSDPGSGVVNLVAAVSSHRAPPCSLDFTCNGVYIMSADIAGALYWTDAGSGLPVSNPSSVRDLPWETWTSPVGWPTLGIQKFASNTERSAVESAAMVVRRSKGGNLLAAGDQEGNVQLSRWPASAPYVGCLAYHGHSQPLSAAAWSIGDESLLTAGKDGCIIRWRRLSLSVDESEGETMEDQQDKDSGNCVGDSAYNYCPQPPPWSQSLLPPTHVSVPPVAPPALSLRVERMHGSSARSGVKYAQGGCAVFVAGVTCCSLNPVTGHQTFHQNHLGRVEVFGVSPDGRCAGSGDLRGQSLDTTLHIWDTGTGALLSKFVCRKGGLTSLSFSPDGMWLAVTGKDRDNTVSVYHSPTGQWWDAIELAANSSGRSPPAFSVFLGTSNFPLMSGGQKTASLLNYKPGHPRLHRITCNFGSGPDRIIQAILCGTRMTPSTDGECRSLTGTASGQLYVWCGSNLSQVVEGHTGEVTGLCSLGKGFASVGSDGLVRLWDSKLILKRQLSCLQWAPIPTVSILQSIEASPSGAKLILSTQGGEIYQVAVESGTAVQISNSHSIGQLRGLTTHPSLADCYVTTGDDQMLHVWSRSQKRWLQRTRLDAPSRAVSFSLDGEYLAVGFGGGSGTRSKDGFVQILRASTLEVEHEVRPAKCAITDIRYSYSGTKLALVTEGGDAYILDAGNKFCTVTSVQLKTESGDTSPLLSILSLDWSTDDSVLRLATAGHEMFHVLTSDGSVISSKAQVKDLSFSSQSTPVGWNVMGIYGASDGASESVACLATSLSSSGTLLAAGYADGSIKVMQYPAPVMNAPSVTIVDHSSPITRLVWAADDSAILSVSAEDRLIVEHKVIWMNEDAANTITSAVNENEDRSSAQNPIQLISNCDGSKGG